MRFKDFLSIVELRTKIVSVSSLLFGGLIGLKLSLSAPLTQTVSLTGNGEQAHFGLGVYVVMFLSALAVDMGTTAFNTFFDYWNGTDKRSTNRESDKILVHKGAPPGHALLVAVLLYLFAVASGIAVAALTSWWVIPIGAICMLVGFFYTAGPRPIASTPLGELFAGGFLGFVLIELTTYVCTGLVSGQALLLGIPSSLFIASILTVNNTNDIQGDTLAGRKTLSIVVGLAVSRIVVLVLGGAAYITAAVLLVVQPLGSLLGIPASFDVLRLVPLLAAIALSIRFYRAMYARGFSHATKGPNMGAISKAFMFFSAGTLVALAL